MISLAKPRQPGPLNAGYIEWREPIQLAERIKEHKARNGGTLKGAALDLLPD